MKMSTSLVVSAIGFEKCFPQNLPFGSPIIAVQHLLNYGYGRKTLEPITGGSTMCVAMNSSPRLARAPQSERDGSLSRATTPRISPRGRRMFESVRHLYRRRLLPHLFVRFRRQAILGTSGFRTRMTTCRLMNRLINFSAGLRTFKATCALMRTIRSDMRCVKYGLHQDISSQRRLGLCRRPALITPGFVVVLAKLH